MNGDDFLAFAGKLAVQHRDPPGARTAVSRAYYGVFHTAKDLLERLGLYIPTQENAHKKLVMYYANSKQPIAQNIAGMLGDLHERRKKADYALSDVRWESLQFAQNSLERTHEIRSLLMSLEQEPNRSAFAQGVTNYLSGGERA
jgi:uncharacterized protein (UPF0332 family)